MAKRNFKRLLVVSDFHCGHVVGMTPPRFWSVIPEEECREKEIALHQRELWNWYAARIQELEPIDYVVVNGDSIDGKGLRVGSTEAIQTARNKQCEMAALCIDECNSKEAGLIHGTTYHDGGQEDWAHIVAVLMDTPTMFVSGHRFFKFGKWYFDFKHKIGRSTIPHGQATPLKRAKLWNILWNARDKQQPKADFLIRSHVHYYDEDYDEVTRCRGFITAALQGYGSKFGVRECENTVDIGMLYFDLTDKGDISWTPIMAKNLEQQTVSVTIR